MMSEGDSIKQLTRVAWSRSRSATNAAEAVVRAELAALDLKWAAASNFIRDVLFACGKDQSTVVDLPALAMEVLGQIERWKHEAAEAQLQIEALTREKQELNTRFLRTDLEREYASSAEAQLRAQLTSPRAELADARDRIDLLTDNRDREDY